MPATGQWLGGLAPSLRCRFGIGWASRYPYSLHSVLSVAGSERPVDCSLVVASLPVGGASITDTAGPTGSRCSSTSAAPWVTMRGTTMDVHVLQDLRRASSSSTASTETSLGEAVRRAVSRPSVATLQWPAGSSTNAHERGAPLHPSGRVLSQRDSSGDGAATRGSRRTRTRCRTQVQGRWLALRRR